MKLKHILILQNKIDLVKESQAKEQYEQILAFVKGLLLASLQQFSLTGKGWRLIVVYVSLFCKTLEVCR
jgi:hypothetical protein